MTPKVLVIGLGGVGAIAAYQLDINGKAQVSVIVRKQTDEFLAKGLEIDSVIFGKISWIPPRVFSSTDEAGAAETFDYVVLCTKNLPDSKLPSHEMIKLVVSTNTTIVLIQNGLDIETPILQRYPNNLVLSGISLIGSYRYGTQIKQLAIDYLQLGIFKKNNLPKQEAEAKLQLFYDCYKLPNDQNTVLIDEDAEAARWYKLFYNSVYNTVCTILDTDLTRVHINNGHKDIFHPLLAEISAIAKSEGYEFTKEKLDFLAHKSDGLFFHPSMQIDKEKDQLMEIEVIIGNPLRIAEKNGVPTPLLLMIYHFLKIIQFNIKEKLGYFTINEDDFRGDSYDAPDIFKKLYSDL